MEDKTMSQSVNKVILIGFLGEAPEVRFSQQGKPVGTFSVAVNERRSSFRVNDSGTAHKINLQGFTSRRW